MTPSQKKKSNRESDRVKALYRYESLEKGAQKEQVFDRLAALAAQICDVPVAYIKLITDEAQYIKASFGAEWDGKPEKPGICQHTVHQDEILEIRDSHTDELFKKNPDLNGSKELRFYAGVPLKTPDGYNIGTLCLMDTQPGQLSDSQKEALTTLADEIMSRFELNRIRDQLAKKNEEKDELIKIVSHDIRNPLAGILSYSELLKEELTNDEHHEMIRSIQKGGEDILSIINLMLDSEFVRNKAFIVRKKEIDAVQSIHKVIKLYQKAIEKKRQNLVLDLPVRMKANLDKDKWEQIIGNLLSNATRYTDVDGTITIQLKNTVMIKDLLELSVSDTGIGMSEEILENLYSGKESIIRKCTEGKKSSGFGMFITKKYVSLMKGMISVTSEVGRGSEINVRIPI